MEEDRHNGVYSINRWCSKVGMHLKCRHSVERILCEAILDHDTKCA